MGYRTILVELNSETSVEARLRVARSLAARFGATLVGMRVTAPVIDLAVWAGAGGAYVAPELIEAQQRAEREARDRVRAVFDRVAAGDPAPLWREAEGEPGRLLAEAARTADLVIAGRDDAGAFGITEELVAAAGVPVLVLPADTPEHLGRTVLAAWNGSREAARAAHDALPFLTRGAGLVVLCAVGKEAGEDLDAAATMLARHGVPVRAERAGEPDAWAGEILLDRAAAHGADLLVMGAYGHTRLRELVFGGATRHMLSHAKLPVLFGG
jgi:nucleotide-binding universal stress UspA family protein